MRPGREDDMPRRITDLPEPPESSYDRIMKRALGVPMFPYRIPLRELLLGVIHDHDNPEAWRIRAATRSRVRGACRPSRTWMRWRRNDETLLVGFA